MLLHFYPISMKSINRVSILGRVVADPELKATKSGKSVSSFAIATNNEWYDSEGEVKKSADFHRIVSWGKLAELCSRHLRKGSPVFVEGRLTNRSYEGSDKNTHYITEIVLNDLHLVPFERSNQTADARSIAEEPVEASKEEAKELVAA